MHASRSNEVVRRFFAGLTEYAFQTQLGVVDTQLTDYVTDMLTRFTRYDALLKLRNLTGHRMEEVAQMLSEADARVGDARREAHRHIGDFTLFWTGLYPEALNRAHDRATKDRFVYYCQHGKRAYFIASTIRSSDADAECEVFERLSHDFELCVYGLGEVRRQWERREGEAGTGPIVIE